METKVISSGVRYSSLPESYVRPESERPKLSEVAECENVPVIDLGCRDRGVILQQIRDACQQYGYFQVITHGGSMEAAEKMLVVAPEFFRLPVEEKLKLYSDDPSKTMRLSTSFNMKKDTVHDWSDYFRLHCNPSEKFVTEWISNPSTFKEDQDHQCPHCNSHTNVLLPSCSGKPRCRSCRLCHRTWYIEKKPMDSPKDIDLSGFSIARSGDTKDAVGLGGVTGIVRNTIDKSVAADRQKEIRGKKLKGPALNFDAEASSSSNCGSGTNQTPSDDTSSHDGKPLSQSPSSPTGTQATQEEHRINIDEPSALNLLDRMRVTQEIRGKKLKGPALNFDTEASSSSNCGSGTNQTPSGDTSSHDGKPLSQSPSSPTNTQATQEEHRIIIDEPSALNLLDRMLEKIKKDELMKPLFEGAIDYVAKLNDVVIGTASAANIGLVGFAETGSSFSPTLSFIGVANATALVCAFTAIPLRPKKPEASRIMTKIGGIASSSSIVGAMGMFLPDNIAWASWFAAIIPAVAVALM